MARKRGTFRIFYNGLDPSGTGNPGTAWVTGRGFGAFQRPVNTVQQLISYIMSLKPLAYWPLNDPAGSLVAKDISGNGFNGTVSGSVTFGSTGLTNYGEPTASFAGGYIETACTLKTSPFTALFLVNYSSAGYNAIVTNGDAATNGFLIAEGTSGPTVYTQTFPNGTAGTNVALALNTTGLVVYTNTGGVGTQTIGSTSVSKSQPYITPSTPIIIGSASLAGRIAHVAILPYAMPAAQITALQNFITAGPVPDMSCAVDAAVGPVGGMRALLNPKIGFVFRPNGASYWVSSENVVPGQTEFPSYTNADLLSGSSPPWPNIITPPNAANAPTPPGSVRCYMTDITGTVTVAFVQVY